MSGYILDDLVEKSPTYLPDWATSFFKSFSRQRFLLVPGSAFFYTAATFFSQYIQITGLKRDFTSSVMLEVKLLLEINCYTQNVTK